MALEQLSNMTEVVESGFSWLATGTDVLMTEPYIYFTGFLIVGVAARLGVSILRRLTA